MPRSIKRAFRKTLAIALSILLSTDVIAFAAETAQQTCDRLAGDSVKLEAIDANHAVPACAAAVAATQQNSKMEYQYGRALERAGRLDQAKGMYQWAADDGLAPASAALARLNSQTKSAATTNDHAEREQMASRLDALAAIAKKIANAAPRDHDDPVAVLAKTGTDPVSIVNWVRTNTRLIPYAGLLRGSSGVLMDRAGNSLDRSLLLGDLLHRAGYEVRLTRAQLDPKIATALRERMEASVSKPSPPAPPDRAELLKQIGNDPRLDRAMVEKAVDQTIADNQRFETRVKDLYGKVFPAVMQALGSDPKRDQRLAADAEATLRDHFWVQRRAASGWEDLDPDADVVHKLTPAATFALDQIPDALKHRVTLRVILETWSAGKLSEAKLLERSWTPSELIGKSITLRHALLPQTPIDEIAQQPDAQGKYIDTLTRAWVIEPILRLGNDTITDKLYTLGGEVHPASLSTLQQLGVVNVFANFGKLQNGLNQAFGNSPNATQYGGPPDQATVKVTAEWIEFQIDAPGNAPERHRRAIFDLIGPAARADFKGAGAPEAAAIQGRAFALSADIDLYIFAATPSADWIQKIVGEHSADAARIIAGAVRSAGRLEDAMSAGYSSPRLELPLWGWALMRIESGLSPSGPPSETNIAALWQVPVLGTGTSFKRQIIFDIIANGVSGKLADRVQQGVLDTVIEHAIMGDSALRRNAAALHAIDSSAGKSWIRIDQTNASKLGSLDLTADTRARIRAELAENDVVIAPTGPVSTASGSAIAWWRIDPKTGATLGIDETGRGAEMEEEAWLNETLESAGVCLGATLASLMVGEHGLQAVVMSMACLVGTGISASVGGGIAIGIGVLEILVRMFEMHEWSQPHGHGE